LYAVTAPGEDVDVDVDADFDAGRRGRAAR
jgi:hypothetical protein